MENKVGSSLIVYKSPVQQHYETALARANTMRVTDKQAHWDKVKHLYKDTGKPVKAPKIEQQ